MKTTLSLLRQHWLAVFLAVLIGIICIGPYFYFEMTPEYHGVALMGQDAEDHYLARIQEAYDGYPTTGNVFLPYKNTPYLLPSLGEASVAGMGRVLGMSATEVNIFSKFIFPLVAFIFVYMLGFAMSGRRMAALLGSALSMLATDFMSYPRNALALFRGASVQDGIYWARPINPEFSGMFLFLTLWLIYRSFVVRGFARAWEIISMSLLFGLFIYVSPYPWSFLGALLVVLFIYALWQKKFLLAKQLFITGILGALCAIPFIINYLHAKAAVGYAFAAQQQLVLSSHAPVFGIWVFVLLLLPVFLWPKFEKESRLFFVACAVALICVLNQQVLTGVYLQPGHFHWYITKPLVGLMLGLWLVLLAERYIKPSLQLVGVSVVIIGLIYAAAMSQVHFYALHSPAAIAAQGYEPLLNYLRAQPKLVVYADETLSSYIPIYTSDDAPTDAYADMYLAPAGYFDSLNTIEHNPNAAAPQAFTALGITTVIVDRQNDTWQPNTALTKETTVLNRFDVYEVPTSALPPQ